MRLCFAGASLTGFGLSINIFLQKEMFNGNGGDPVSGNPCAPLAYDPQHRRSRGTMRTKTGKRRPQAESRHASMTLILDCAEAEFAEKGYNGATLASVAELAAVDTSLMRYYFGDKEQLFEAVFMRRAPASNKLRQKAMAEYRASAGDAMTLEGIVDAFTRPVFELGAQDEGWRNY